MAHFRERRILEYLKKCLAFSPLVGLIGHRQVGKTTLLGDVSVSYYSLDDEECIAYSVDSASEFIREVAGPRPVGIDEAQLMPELFPALKEHVRKRKTPGQFLLSGSVRFTSLKSVRESLTGRIITLELLPLSVNELMESGSAAWLPKIHSKLEFNEPDAQQAMTSEFRRKAERVIEQYSSLGGLPGICFVRNEKIRSSKLQTQLGTILDRDLREVVRTGLGVGQLFGMLQALAERQSRPVVLKELLPGQRLNANSIRSVLNAMESLFLIRSIPVQGDRGGFACFFEDIAEYRHVLGRDPTAHEVDRVLTFQLVRSAFAPLHDESTRFFQYRTRGGAEIPLAVQTRLAITGFIPIQEERPNKSEQASARSFLAKYPKSKVVFCGSSVRQMQVMDARQLLTPFSYFCAD